MQRPPWLVATMVHSVGLGGWPRSKHMDRTKKSWGKEEPANGGNAGWEGSGVDQITGSSSAAQTPVPGPGLPGTCILATSWSTFWPTSSWLFCRAPQATSRSCSSCFSFPVSSDSLRLASCSAPFRSESWSACFLRIWVRASRTSTSLAQKRHLCLGPACPLLAARSRLGSLQGGGLAKPQPPSWAPGL